MSYLDTPRICFLGKYVASPPTRNNLLAALDDPSIIGRNPDWDYFPLGDSDLKLNQCQVVSAWDAAGNFITDPAADPVINAAVTGRGKMADLDPEHRRVTDLIGLFLTLALPKVGPDDATVSGTLATTQLRDFWSNSAKVAVTVTSWQSVLFETAWTDPIVARSGVMKQLHDASPKGLSVRLTPLSAGEPFSGPLFGVIGPWSGTEPRQFVAARRLTARRPAGQLNFPVATFQVDGRRQKLVADLGNLPMAPSKPRADLLVVGLVGAVLKTDDEGGGIAATLGPGRDLTADQWLQTAGVVEWDLTPGLMARLADHRLRLTFHLEGEPLLMEESPSGVYVDVDARSLRLDPGESETVGVYARTFGKPLLGQVVDFLLKPQRALAPVEPIVDPGSPGYPADPTQFINSEPADVLLDRPGGLQVMTGADGYAELTVRAEPGEFTLPPARETIDSQLYFLGDPDGWQSWGALGPNNGPLDKSRIAAGCALSVLVFNTHAPIASPAWEDIEPWLARYAFLYPGMLKQSGMNLALKNHVDGNALELYRRLKCKAFDDPAYMPVSRDLSDFRRRTILAYLAALLPGGLPC